MLNEKILKLEELCSELSEYYNNVDKIEQQNIINTALDLYNNVNYLKDILDQI